MQLFNHQLRFLSQKRARALLVWETGTGKTLTALYWAMQVPVLFSKTLVICPKSLKKNWERNIEAHFPNSGISVLSKEEFKRDAHKLPRYDSVIIDEAHFFGNPTSQMTKRLMAYLKTHQIVYRLALTATPYMSTPWNIYSLGLIVGKPWSWPWWNKTFFEKVWMGGRQVPVVRANAHEMLMPLIDEISDVVKLSDCVDVPEDNAQVEYFETNSVQRTFIKKLYEPHFISRWTKIHQAYGGTVKNTEYDATPYTILPSDKFDRVIELGMEVTKPIIVCRYNGEVDRIAAELRAQGKTVFTINGETKDKQAVLDQAHLAPSCAVVVNAACSEGWELPSCDTMIFYSYDFSLKNYIQMKGRIQRINNIKPCTYISLVMQGTSDEEVYQTVVIHKMDFQAEIYEL